MPFNEFYMQTTGHDLNAGSTSADAALYASTAGNWDGVSVFTPTDGSTPASTVSVGMWANIYNTGDGVVRYLAQVTAVAGGVNGAITFSTTAKYGTAPTSNNGSRNLRVGGAWASSQALSTRLTGVTAPASTRINIRAGTYPTLSSQNWGIGGTAGVLVWYRGYKTSPGDLDTLSLANLAAWTPGTDCPLFNWSTTGLTVSGKDAVLSGLAFVSASTTSSAVTVAANNVLVHRCVCVATGANVAANAVKMNNAAADLELCYCKATSSAAVVSATNASCEIRGNNLEGGLNTISLSGTGPWTVLGNVCDSPAADAVVQGANFALVCQANTIFNPGGHGLSLVSTLTADVSISGNLFHTVAAAGKVCVASAGTTDVASVRLVGNALFNCNAGSDSNGVSTGLGDMPAFDTTIEAVNPLPGAGSRNFTYAGVTGRGAGFPALFQNTTAGTVFAGGKNPGATDPASTTVCLAQRRVVLAPASRKVPGRSVVIAGSPQPVLLPVPLRRRVYPVPYPAIRRVGLAGIVASASVLVVRTPPRSVTPRGWVRRAAGQALFALPVPPAVLVTSPRYVR
ncbi:MAG: hypothetical protein JSS02_18310 [Planctomycetes bacterium]|nr:hypothetical protein [Planctomycetota bacterium]